MMGGIQPIAEVNTAVTEIIPSYSCEVNEAQNIARFNNYTCKDKNAINKDKADLYLECIGLLILMEITNITLCGKCAELEMDEIGTMFADCEWCTKKYGCFQVGGPFISPCHPLSLPPQPEACFELKLQLYTPLNPLTPQLLNTNLSNIKATSFNFSEKTTIFVGGWREGDFKPYDTKLIAAMLKITKENVIIFNWMKGSAAPYGQTVANTRLGGRILATIVNNLNSTYSYSPSRVHLVGHSAGAQLVGYAGKEVSKIGRITGLDPAGPYFDCENTAVRLDSTDADFVDVIHSNAGVLGTIMTSGHVDFYPNGGTVQEGCELADLLVATNSNDLLFCHHTMSIYFYISSMYAAGTPSGKCDYNAYTCEDFDKKICAGCGVNNSQCIRMGYHAEEDFIYKAPPTQERRYLKTLEKSPHCDTTLQK